MRIGETHYRSIWLADDGWRVQVIDQTRLPHEFAVATLETPEQAADAIKDRRLLAVFVSDTWKKKKGFVGIGYELYALLRKRFRPVDACAVVRGNRKLEKPNFHRAAAEGNFFLRGFNHLLIFKKER